MKTAGANYWDSLLECADIGKDRGESYGTVEGNFKDIQNIYHAISGNSIELKDIALLMLSTKLSREKNKHKKDNPLDGINYLAIYNYIVENNL